MKKIYSKLTKERDLHFQIETAVFMDKEGVKTVEKRPLQKEAEPHVKNMYENFMYFSSKGKEFFLSCEWKGSSVFFPYIEGKSFYEKLIQSAEKKDRAGFECVLEEYDSIVREIYADHKPFSGSEKFEEIFGIVTELDGVDAAEKVDIDLTFDNVLKTDDGVKIFDYEWMFDCLVPVKFPVYRAVYALWVKHAQLLQDIISESELYGFFKITEQERHIFKGMNDRFMEYVEGRENSYQKMLEVYKKQEVKLQEKDAEVSGDYAEVFWGVNRDFDPQREKKYIWDSDKKIRMEINVNEFADTDCIRIDPGNWSVMLKVRRLEVETEKSVRKITRDELMTNAGTVNGDLWIFRAEDPQILIPVKEKEGWEKIIFEFEIMQENLENIEAYVREMQAENKKEMQKLQVRTQELEALAEGQARLLSQSAHKLAEYENTIQLLKDKIAYIESTKAYQTFIKGKVDKIDLWDSVK